MSLDGLRAWIGEVERKLDKRTRVFLVLVAIAVGGAGAAIYLAIEAQENSVTKADVQQVRDELASRIGTGGGETDVTQLEAELEALQAEVAKLKEKESAPKGTGDNSTGTTKEGSTKEGATGNTSPEGSGSRGKQLLESLAKQAGK
jgi:seryl-tRNA synthetase